MGRGKQLLPQQMQNLVIEDDTVTKCISEAIDMIKSESQDKILEGVAKIRLVLSVEKNPPIDSVLNAGGLPLLVDCLKHYDNPKIQFEAVWGITNIASGTSDHTLAVIKSGALSHFLDLLDSEEKDIREQTVWALGNIAGDSPSSRDLVLQLDVLPKIVKLICDRDEGQDTSLMRNTVWALSNLCRGKPQPDFDVIKACLPALVHIITHFKDEEVVTDAAWALSYLSDGGDENIHLVAKCGIVKNIVGLLSHHNLNIVTPVLRTIGNLVTGDDYCTQIVLDEGLVNYMSGLLYAKKKAIRKETCWTISNITAGNKAQIQSVIEAGLIPKLISMVMTEQDPDILRESLWALGNGCSGGTDLQIEYFVTVGIINALCRGLEGKNPNPIKVSLEALDNILRAGEKKCQNEEENPYAVLVYECGGLDLIEQLQGHQDHAVYTQAVHLLENYFGVEEEEDVVVSNENGQFSFGHAGNNTGGSSGGGFNF